MSRSSACWRNALAGHENAIAFGGAAAHATAQLVKLREAEAFGMFDDHDRGVGHVDADFDDGGGDEDIDFAALKAAHDDFLFVGIEAAMKQANAQARERTVAQLFVHFDGGFES